MKDCPGEGCQNRIPASQEMCTGCKMKAEQEEARVSLWAHEGMKALRVYLRKWAEFEEIHGPN